jgi:MFS family permease
MPITAKGPPRSSRTELIGLGFLFGAMYFAQGISEPTDGLIAQPVRGMLRTWGHSVAEISTFGALISLPWAIKPVYGLLTDFVPIRGTRRRSYLLLTSAITALSLAYLFFDTPQQGQIRWLVVCLVIPCVGTAFSDVVVDALMVEKGQPLGLTGRLQSIQWAAMYMAMILAGTMGGWLTQHHWHRWGFLVCAMAAALTTGLTVLFVQEPTSTISRPDMRQAISLLRDTVRLPIVWGVGAFLFLWSFNPFSTVVLHGFMTRELRMSEQFYGTTVSVLAVGAVVASVGYGLYCRVVPFLWLIHASIVGGILCTVAYWALTDRTSALVVSFLVGFAYMTASLVQFDLAARVCPAQTAGTTLAVLMSASNLGMALSASWGGYLYDRWGAAWGHIIAFRLLVAVGAAFTACCWFLVPWVARPRNVRGS